jgi:mannosyltransferase PIG-V
VPSPASGAATAPVPSRGRPAALAAALRREDAALALVGIRVAYWLGIAFTLLWAPLRGARAIPSFEAYGPLSDLVFGTFAQWDSVWFLHIAEHGYDSEQITAFFPLYPLAVRGVAEVVRSTLVAGVLVSLASAAVAAGVLARIARRVLGERAAGDAVLYVALYPLAFVFTALYSEGLFLALSAGAFLAAQRRSALAAGVLGGLAAATRPAGLALLPALAVLLWPRRRSARELARLAPLALLPLAVAAYAAYLRHRFGDALVFVHAEGISWNRHVPALGPLGGLWDATTAGWHGTVELLRHLPRRGGYPEGYVLHDRWASWNALQFALLVLASWLTWVAWRRLGAAFGLYSATFLAVVLASPADLVPLAGLPRYLLADFPLFLALASLTEGRPRARQAVLVSFAAVGAVAAAAFARKVWIA